MVASYPQMSSLCCAMLGRMQWRDQRSHYGMADKHWNCVLPRTQIWALRRRFGECECHLIRYQRVLLTSVSPQGHLQTKHFDFEFWLRMVSCLYTHCVQEEEQRSAGVAVDQLNARCNCSILPQYRKFPCTLCIGWCGLSSQLLGEVMFGRSCK